MCRKGTKKNRKTRRRNRSLRNPRWKRLHPAAVKTAPPQIMAKAPSHPEPRRTAAQPILLPVTARRQPSPRPKPQLQQNLMPRPVPGRTAYAPTTRSIQRTAAMRRQMKPMRKNPVHMTANSAPSKKRFPPCRKASRQRIKKRYRHRLMKLPRSLQLWQRAKARMFSIFPHMKT